MPLVHANAVRRAAVARAVVHRNARLLAVGPGEPRGTGAASQGSKARVFIEAFDSTQSNAIGFVEPLITGTVSEGLTRPYVYDTPPSLSRPQRTKKKGSSRDDQKCNRCHH